MQYGILDHLSESSVEAQVLGPQAIIHCYECTEESQLPEDLSELDAVMVWHVISLSGKTLRRLESCRALIRVGVGYDNIDCRTAGELGIPVVNIPDYGTNDVADHTMAMLLTLARRLFMYDDAVRVSPASNWKHDIAGKICRLEGSTLGIVGLGRIGTAVALRASAFGIRVAFYDPYLDDGYDKSYQVHRAETLEELKGFYYRQRGWDEDGRPKEAKLRELGLAEMMAVA